MLLRVIKTCAAVACVVMVALVTNAYAGGCPSCATGAPCASQVYSPQPTNYCVSGRCCQPSHPWGFTPRQWMPWPGEDRDDVGSPSTLRGTERLPTPEGTVPLTLPPEEYPVQEAEGGIGDIQIEGSGEAPMPYSVPTIDPSGMGSGLPDLPSMPPAGNLPLDQPEGALSPDILPAEPFSIEGTEGAPADEKPDVYEKPLTQNQLGAPLPTIDEPVQLGEAPLPTIEPGSFEFSPIVTQEAAPIRLALPSTEPITLGPAYAPAPLPSVRPSSYSPIRESAPVYLEEAAPISNEWRSRRTRSEEPSPLPSLETPSSETPREGRHVMYESSEAPMPEAIQVAAVIEKAEPLALEGYCPVELVLNERWIEGDAKWTATHDGRNYKFSSREAFDSFCRSPELYAPYYSGLDPIISLVGGGMVDGRTDLCAVYRGRLYMFSSQESLEQFRANPAQCVEAFNANLKIK